MKIIRLLPLLLGLVFAGRSEASRILEIEQFYHAKVKELLETRFPQTPFAIYVTVDTGRTELTRRDVQRQKEKKDEGAKLPFWYENQEEKPVDIFERMDVPLGSLIKELKSIKVDVRVDATLNEAELGELKDTIAKQLKLDPGVDSIEISRMPWTDQERYRNLYWMGGILSFAFILIVGVFWLLSRLSINSLIHGLSGPIAEIGKSTQKFANSALNLATDLSAGGPGRRGEETEASSVETDVDLNLLEIRRSALELIERNRSLFENPDADFLNFIERKGQADPVTMGSILAELSEEALRDLFRFGSGDWWYKAIAQPAPLRAQSLALLGEIDRLRVRRHFGRKENGQAEEREYSLIFSRLKTEEFIGLLKGMSLEEASPLIELLPREQGLAVAKSMFPGQWAYFLKPKSGGERSKKVLEDLKTAALKVRPLRNEGEIKEFFADFDLSVYLDAAPPRDERDFYSVLPEDSRIRQQRYPFFQVIDGDETTFKALAAMFSAAEWALALWNCEAGEKKTVLDKFPDRLRYQVVERGLKVTQEGVDPAMVRRVRRNMVHAFLNETHRQRNLKVVHAATESGNKESSNHVTEKERAA